MTETNTAQQLSQANTEQEQKITPASLKQLNPIKINRRVLKNAGTTLYRVYSAPGDYKLVEAESAHEAFAKSELTKVYKIEREHFFRYIALAPDMFDEREEEPLETSTLLPDPQEMKTLLMAALGDDALALRPKASFEEVAFSDMWAKEAASSEAAAAPATMPESAVQNEEQPAESKEDVMDEAPAEAAPEEPEEELSASEVDALLNSEE